MMICGFCKREFVATPQQELRNRYKSVVRPHGFMCSMKCVGLHSVTLREAKRGRVLYQNIIRSARAQVNSEVGKGRLAKPDVCSTCGKKPGTDKIGRSRLQAHHADHSKPLDIVWLCWKCHKDVSWQAIGEENPAAILTEAEVREIKKALEGYKHGMVAELGRKYGVKAGTITAIKRGRLWKHVQVGA